MASEDIVMEQTQQSEWAVHATYRFENTTDQDVTIQMGFPELGCMGDCDMNHPYTMNGLQTTVRGTAVSHRTGRIDAKKRPKWAPKLGLIHLFDVTFKAKETVVVEHRYRHAMSTSVDGPSVTYLTRTGAFWSGTIGHAKFTVRHRITHHTTTVRDAFTLKSRREYLKEGVPTWEYIFEAKDWTPKVDFYAFFGNEYAEGYPATDCPRIHNVLDDWKEEIKAGRTESEADRTVGLLHFTKIEKATLTICQNWPYAIHGKPFRTKRLHKLFYTKAKRSACEHCTKTEGKSPENRTFSYRVNPDYSDDLLSQWEKMYLRASQLGDK